MGSNNGTISTKEILKFLAMGGIIVAALVVPNIVQGFRFLFKDKNYVSWKKFNNISDARARQYVNRLKRRGLIKGRIKNRKMEIVLTKRGREEILKYDFEKMGLKKEKNWDGKWRVVIFDIPEFQKNARDALRRKFKSLGMFQLQKSVFVYPYDCKKEIDFVSGFFNVAEHIFYLESKIEDIGNRLMRIFGIR